MWELGWQSVFAEQSTELLVNLRQGCLVPFAQLGTGLFLPVHCSFYIAQLLGPDSFAFFQMLLESLEFSLQSSFFRRCVGLKLLQLVTELSGLGLVLDDLSFELVVF